MSFPCSSRVLHSQAVAKPVCSENRVQVGPTRLEPNVSENRRQPAKRQKRNHPLPNSSEFESTAMSPPMADSMAADPAYQNGIEIREPISGTPAPQVHVKRRNLAIFNAGVWLANGHFQQVLRTESLADCLCLEFKRFLAPARAKNVLGRYSVILCIGRFSGRADICLPIQSASLSFLNSGVFPW